jgi:hypothetical protein
MVIPLDDVRKRERPCRIERSRSLADPIAAPRRLVKYEGKPLVEPPYRNELWQSGLDIYGTWARRDEAQIRCAYTTRAQHIFGGRGVNYNHREAVFPESDDGALNCRPAVGKFDARYGIGAAPGPI